MRSNWQGICLWAAVLMIHASGAFAQGVVTPEDEYRKAIKVSEDIQPLGENPFGEQVSLYTGGLSFKQTDVSLAGRGPVLELSRELHLEGATAFRVTIPDHAFGDWEIDLPRIETLTAHAGTLNSWQTSGSGSGSEYRNKRCSNFREPPPVSFPGDSARDPWTSYEWWNGYHLIVPGAGDQELMPRSETNTLSPTMAGKTFSIVTKQHWQISCLPQTSSGEPGEAFFAVSPDGTKYWFDYLVYKADTTVEKALRSGPGPGFAASMSGGVSPMAVPINILPRRKAWMLATRIEDRFGNALTYKYDGGRLSWIEATDGRKITIQYQSNSPRIASVVLQPSSGGSRTWNYQYGGTDTYRPHLTGVALPDNSIWSFDLAGLTSAEVDFRTASHGSCYVSSVPGNLASVYSGSITHPSGLVGTFKVKPMAHGRSGVYRHCWGVQTDPNVDGYAITPSLWYSLNLVEKKFAGAGLNPQIWSYQYSAPNNSWSADCPTATACPSTITTSVVDPEDKATRYTFSNFYDYTESLLLKTEFFSGAMGSSVARMEVNQYAVPSTGPWPLTMGSNLQWGKQNDAQTTQLFPQNKRVIQQDGDTYTWQAEAFDAYAQVTKTKRYNSISGQSPIEESTSYRNDTALWVLGLPLQVTNNTTGEVESSNTYTASNDTLLTRSRFGQPLMSYTFNSTGQLTSFKDGNNHTTTLSNYKRGIPQTIGYPDSTSQSLVVDDFGQVASTTDQAGHTTSYSYDPVGRVTGITYPAGDEIAWYPKTFAYSFVTGAERGVPANHWKRTTTTGGAKAVTYFDAMLRPILSDSAINSSVQTSTLVNYNPKGETIFASYPSATALNFTNSPTMAGSKSSYDSLGRLTQVQQTSELGTLTSSISYLSGARQQTTDPKGNVTTTSYQVFDSPSYDAVTKVQAPAGITQNISRDLYGNPLSITQSGLYGTGSNSVTKTFAYDSYHRLCRTTEPESGSTVMAYDNVNNLAWSAQGLSITGSSCGQEQVAAAAKTSRTYDTMNRLLTIQSPAGTQSTIYTYDALGQMLSSISGINIQGYEYNARGMLTREVLWIPSSAFAWTLGYRHDASGALSQVSYPDEETVNYAPDALGRPTQASGYANSIGYFANGQIKQFNYANGATYVAEQNTRQLPSNFSYGTGSTPVLSEDLDYDKNGNIVTVADLTGGPRNKAFEYDALNRLTRAQAPGLSINEAYTYDALNNLRSRLTGGYTLNLNYDTSNRLGSMTVGGNTFSTYTHDPRGNRSSTAFGGATTSYLFDAKNQLTGIVGSDSYAYDAAGRRVSKTAGGVTTYYFYSQAGQLMYQWEPGKGRTTSFVYLGSKMIGDNESTALGAPATIGFDTNPNNGSYVVSWGEVSAATSYTLQERTNGGGWTTVYSGSTASKALTGRAGGSYTYQVRGCIGNTCGAWTSSATLGVHPAPPTVTVPSGTINGTYTVSWTTPVSSTGYDVQERVNGGAWSTIASNTPATAISRSGTTSGSYSYQVAARNAHGAGAWAGSATVIVDTAHGVLADPPATLTVPASSSNGSGTLSWSVSTLATRYVVEQSADGGTNWVEIYNANGTSAALSGLSDGSYRYRVQACNTYGCSAWKPGSVTLVVTHPPTAAPTVAVPSSSGSGSYTVSWSGVPGQVSYTVQEQNNGGGWATVQSNGTTSKAVSGKGNGSYGYRVQACNAGGCGPWSNTATIAVLLSPAAPASITIPATSSGSVAVSWAPSSTATSYTLQHANYGITGWSTIYSGSATSRTQQETTSGAYIYQVQACNSGGCSVFRGINSGVTVTIPPAAAPSVSAPATSNTGGYTVSWGGAAEATNYTLQEQINGGGWSTIQNSSVRSKAISGKGNGSYGYRVQASNVGGVGPWSSTKTIAVLLLPATPAAPYVSSTGPDFKPVVKVSWVPLGGATSYQLEETLPQGSATIVQNSSATSWSQLTFATGEVLYRVKACNSVGCSAFSGYRSVILNSGSGFLLKEPADPSAESKELSP